MICSRAARAPSPAWCLLATPSPSALHPLEPTDSRHQPPHVHVPSPRRARAVHMGSTYSTRMSWEAQPRFPASPNPHCHPGVPLPASPRLRAKTTFVNPSTHRMKRCPPHTDRQKQLHAAMYGMRPSEWSGVLGHAGSSFNRQMQAMRLDSAGSEKSL